MRVEFKDKKLGIVSLDFINGECSLTSLCRVVRLENNTTIKDLARAAGEPLPKVRYPFAIRMIISNFGNLVWKYSATYAAMAEKKHEQQRKNKKSGKSTSKPKVAPVESKSKVVESKPKVNPDIIAAFTRNKSWKEKLIRPVEQ